jgi:hypothetical protein
MDNAIPVIPGDKRRGDQKLTKKPYSKPAFRFERVFETQALACGKVLSRIAQCHANRKTS